MLAHQYVHMNNFQKVDDESAPCR